MLKECRVCAGSSVRESVASSVTEQRLCCSGRAQRAQHGMQQHPCMHHYNTDAPGSPHHSQPASTMHLGMKGAGASFEEGDSIAPMLNIGDSSSLWGEATTHNTTDCSQQKTTRALLSYWASFLWWSPVTAPHTGYGALTGSQRQRRS